MKYLDLNGLKHLLKFIDRTVRVATSKYEVNSEGRREIPFITNHQIISMDISNNIDVFNWLKDASEGGILEIVFAGAQGGYVYCMNQGTSLMYQMKSGQHGPQLTNIDYLSTTFNTYARLIKSNGRLIVAEFVTNQ